MPRRKPRRAPRTQRAPQERQARSQAVRRVAEEALLRGSLVRIELTLLIVFVLLQCFWLRNLKPQRRAGLTLISLARELDRTLSRCRAPWHRQLARGP